MQILLTFNWIFLSTKGKEHNSAPKSSNSGITQAVTQPKIRLTQPKNALTQFTGNYAVGICRKIVEKKTLLMPTYGSRERSIVVVSS